MAQAQNLVNAAAGRRLGAALLDAVPYLIAYIVLLAMLVPMMQRQVSDPSAAPSGAIVLPSLFMLGYSIFLWGWEAMTGKTPGNVLLGIRTTNEDGFAPGWWRVLLRRLIVSVAGIVPIVGPVLVLVSNLWDPNAQRQGWHDKVAKTLMVDVRTGRNPISTGGLYGPAAFAPREQPAPTQQPVMHRDDVEAGGYAAQGYAAQGYQHALPEPVAPITGVPGMAGATAAAPQLPPPPPAAAMPDVAAEPGFAAEPMGAAALDFASASDPLAAPEAAPVADHRPIPEPTPEPTPEPAPEPAVDPEPAPEQVLLTFDDGQSTVLTGTLLIGRNPAPAPDEGPVDLFNVADLGRSVSKTHLSLTLAEGGLWVTDRHSTNGSAITGVDGGYRQLQPGVPEPVRFGESVHFGDRSFEVARP